MRRLTTRLKSLQVDIALSRANFSHQKYTSSKKRGSVNVDNLLKILTKTLTRFEGVIAEIIVLGFKNNELRISM